MKFKFSYQKLLDIKKKQEDQKSLEVVAAEDVLKKAKVNFEKLKLEKGSILNQKFNKSTSPTTLMIANSYVYKINNKLEAQKIKINKEETNLDKKRKELFEMTKSRKILDKLKESSFKKFMINETRKDQKEIDEISATISIKSKKDN
ncbi:MAG: flagellar export protein FliJ [Candidatus Neomarinimicrobiota bacterium]|jgi:flagellar FliJ protein|nr:flagellar export protein FliJ [Candidatus Neomarinimicrobiota bacterium]